MPSGARPEIPDNLEPLGGGSSDSSSSAGILRSAQLHLAESADRAFLTSEEARKLAETGEARRDQLNNERSHLLAEIERATRRIATIDGVLDTDEPAHLSATLRQEYTNLTDARRIVSTFRKRLLARSFDARLQTLLANHTLDTANLEALLRDESATISGAVGLVKEEMRPRLTEAHHALSPVSLLQPHEGSKHGLLLMDRGGASDFSIAIRIPHLNITSRPFDLMCMCCTLLEDTNKTSLIEQEFKDSLRAAIAAVTAEAGVSSLVVGHGSSLAPQYSIPGVSMLNIPRGRMHERILSILGNSSLAGILAHVQG